MKNKLLKLRTINVAFVALCLLGAYATAATIPGEDLLLQAGFKARVATTASEQHQLQTLPAGKVSPVRQYGKTLYVVPDARNNRIYVGDDAQYQTYQDLVAKQRRLSRPVVIEDDIRGKKIPVEIYHGDL